MRPFADAICLVEMTDVMSMASTSNDTFCSLDMLAEVASNTLKNDPSLNLDFQLLTAKNKVGSSSSKKSVNNCEKLSLEQIKSLSEKNLIEMFSEHICDEMRKNYSFQCFLIPDKCCQVFKSFGNETRARCKMKLHLQGHIRELVAAAQAADNPEIFMAEPLHVRSKRLRELKQKNTRKKKKMKQSSMKLKKDNYSLQLFSKDIADLGLLKTGVHHPNAISDNLNPSSGIDYDNLNEPTMNNFVNVHMNDSSVNNTSKKLKYLPYFSRCSSISVAGAERVILKGQSSTSDFNITYPNSHGKKKHKSKCQTEYKKRVSRSLVLGSNYHSNCNAQSGSEPYLSVHHDHTYTSVNGQILNCDQSSSNESNKSSRKVFRDPFHPRKTDSCQKKEAPLIIPTPPFPYVYIPVLPHIARIQEISHSFKMSRSKCTNDVNITESLCEYICSSNHVPLSLPKGHECPKNSFNQSASEANMIDTENNENTPDTYIEGIMSEDRSNSETNNIKCPDSSFYVDDLITPECPENLRAGEKKLALNYIRALRTKKKDERGPLTCQICKNKSFTAQATLMYHYRSHAGIKPFSCSICDATFTRQHSLNYHMLIHNNESRFVCPDCGRNFRHPSHYKEHLRHHTGETASECTDCNSV